MKMENINIKTILFVAIAVATAHPALAATGDAWADPAIGLIDVLESGLVKIGAALLGIAIIAFGAWGAITAKIEWSKFGFILIGGILIVAGPLMIRTLLEAVRS